MKLAGFSFNKISVEKEATQRPEEVKINTNIEVTKIRVAKSDLFKSKEEMLVVGFSYEIAYEPSFAKIEFLGDVILAIESKIAKNIIKQWKDKKLPEGFRASLFNIILAKANIRALQLEDEMNLPYHIPLPSLRPEQLQQPPKEEKKRKKKR